MCVKSEKSTQTVVSEQPNPPKPAQPEPQKLKEIGGPPGREPTRYGDWELNGRCIDF